MNVEAPKYPISDETLADIRERARQRLEHPDLGFNPLDIVTIFIKNMINFRFDNPDEASIPTKKVNSQTTPEPPPSLGKLIKTFNEVTKNLRHR